jgi:phytoene synthase
VTEPADPPDDVMEEARRLLDEGTRSFGVAARLLPEGVREPAVLLYGWCRRCDDAVDEHLDAGRAALEARVERLREDTRAALAGDPPDRPAFEGLHEVARRFELPSTPALELLDGLAMDARDRPVRTETALADYCYHVAGTVGTLMAHVLDADPRARLHAVHLGIGMQLTNIARDLREDARRGRVYLPDRWLDREEVTAERLAGPGEDPAPTRLAARTQSAAEPYYRSGRAGLAYLPPRAALAIGVAAEVYREIGAEVRRRGDTAWDDTAAVSGTGKLRAVARGAGRAAATVPRRLGSSGPPEPGPELYRPRSWSNE